MADATSLPTISNLKTFQASLPAFQVPALQYGLNDTDVTSTVTFSGVLKDGSGATVTGGFLGTAKTSTGYAETMWFPLLSSTDGQTFTGVVRGIKLGGIDYTTGTSGNVVQHFAGEEVFVGVSAVIDNLIRDSIQGVIGTGGNGFSVGDGTAGTKTYKIYNNTGAVGIIRNTGTRTQYSDDGSVWVNIADVSSSVLVKATSADTTAGYLNDKIDTATAGRLTKSITNPAGNEQVALTLATTLTDAEMNQMHGISANVTSANLNTLTAGATSDASALHTHLNISKFGGTGADGALSVSTNTTLNPAYKVFNYSSVTIDSGKTLSFGSNYQNLPVYFKVAGDCTINGTLSLKGAGSLGGAGGVGAGTGTGAAAGADGADASAANTDVLDAVSHKGLKGVHAGAGGAAGGALTTTGIASIYVNQLKKMVYIIPGVGGGGGAGGNTDNTGATSGTAGSAGSISALPSSGGTGGSASGGGAGGGGGGGGAGGGALVLEVLGNLTIGASGVIDVSGQDAGDGGAGGQAFVTNHGGGGGGGGGGGSGGMAMILYNGTLSNSGSILYAGGNGGNGGHAGVGATGAGSTSAGGGGSGAGFYSGAGGAGGAGDTTGAGGTNGSSGSAGGGAGGGAGNSASGAAGGTKGTGSSTSGYYILEKNVSFA